MYAAFDVHYKKSEMANAACVLFGDYEDSIPVKIVQQKMPIPADYVPGSFYKRELPCILALVKQIDEPIDEVVIDGYVWLGVRPGLGQHLFEALQRNLTRCRCFGSP